MALGIFNVRAITYSSVSPQCFKENFLMWNLPNKG